MNQQAKKHHRTVGGKLTERVIIGGGTFLTGGVLDLIGHGGTGGLGLAAVVAALAFVNSDDVAGAARSLIGVGDAEQTTATAQGVLDQALADVPKHPDQRPVSKLKRLVGMQTPAPPEPKEVQQDEEVAPIQQMASPTTLQPEELYDVDMDEVSSIEVARPTIPEPRIQAAPHIAPLYRASSPEREVLLATRLGLDIDEVIEAGVFIAGMKGSGKSTIAARLMEQTGRFPLTQVIYDIKGDFVSLVNSHFMNGIVMTQDQQYDARTIHQCRLQVVVDLRTWETVEEQASIIAQLNQVLLKYARALPEDARVPWFVHLDEAQQYVSQQKPDGIEVVTWKAVTASVMNLGVLGRAFGAVPCLYTQRIADIHKSVISQQEFRVFMKAALDNDLKRYEEYINTRTARREDIQAFRAGDAVVILPTGQQFITHFLDRESRHGSHTPHLTQALRLQHAQAYAPMPVAIRDEMPVPEPPVRATPMREQVAAYTPVRMTAYAHPTNQLPSELEQAYRAWQDGMSGRDLAKCFKWGHDKGCRVRRQLIERGLITPDGRKV